MIKNLLLITLMFSYSVINAQITTFEISANLSINDEVADVIETTNGDFVAVVNAYVNSNFDITVMSVSPTGIIGSSITIGSANSEFARSVYQTSDGGYLITGNTYSTPSDNDALVIKLDSLFNVQFFKRIGNTPGNDYANNGFETTPGVYTITGTIALGGSAKPAIINMDTTGAILSEHYLNTNQFASPYYHGNYFGNGVIGFAHLSNVVSLVDTAGNVIRDFLYSVGGYSSRAIISNDDHAVTVGVSNIGGPQGSTLSLCKGDTTNGTIIFSTKFQFPGYNFEGVSVVQDSNNNYYIAGNIIDFGSGYSDAVVIKTDDIGNIKWSNQYTPLSANHCKLNEIILTSDNGLLISGLMQTGSNSDLFFAKLDTAGFVGCNVSPLSVASTPFNLNPATAHTPVLGNVITIPHGPVISGVTSPVLNIICNSTNVEELNPNNIDIYPTVFTDQVFINNEISETDEYLVEVVSVSGAKIYLQKHIGNTTINLSDLAAAVYAINVTSKNGRYHLTKKVIKY